MASGGHENQSTSGNSMVAASNSSMVGIGYNNVELPSNSKPQTLEKVGASALRKIAGPLRHNAGTLSFLEALKRPNNAGFQSAEPDEVQGYCSLEFPQKSANKIYVRPSMPNNHPADSEKIHTTDNTANSFPITTAAVTTTTAKVESVPAASAMKANNTTNFPAHIGAAATTSTAKEKNGHGDSPSALNTKKRSFEAAITPLESATTIGSRAADHSLGRPRTSVYSGVSRNEWTGRFKAQLWDKYNERNIGLGVYLQEENAARAHDMAALKYQGQEATINFQISQYKDALEEMQNMTTQEYFASLRRKSSGFSRGASQYRGVSRHHQHRRWQARINGHYLGTFSSEKEAAEAYDVAAIKFKGHNALTNFDMSKYDLKKIEIESSILPIGVAKRPRLETESAVDGPTNNGCSTNEERTLSSQTDATSYINNAARAKCLHLMPLQQQQAKPLRPAYQLQKVSLYDQDLHTQLYSAGNKRCKYLQANGNAGSTHDLHNLMSLGSVVTNNKNNGYISNSTPGIYTNTSNALAITGLQVANPTDRSTVIFGENAGGSALTYGRNMVIPPEHFVGNNLYNYLSQQQQQSSGLAKATSDDLAYNNGMETAAPNLTIGNAPIFSVRPDPQG